MYIVENSVISDDIADQKFVCDIDQCKGACCVKGDVGAPLEEEELPILKEIFDKIRPYLNDAALFTIAKKGIYVEEAGEYRTPLINGEECVYADYDEDGILKCCMEQAYNDGKIDFIKPISCHLYPIRIQKTDVGNLVNFEHWSVCNEACILGDELDVPLYDVQKEPLIRYYGEAWYDKLVQAIEMRGGK